MLLCNNAIYSTLSQAIRLKRITFLSTVMVSSVMTMASTMMSSMVVIVMMVVTSTSDCFSDSNSCGHA